MHAEGPHLGSCCSEAMKGALLWGMSCCSEGSLGCWSAAGISCWWLTPATSVCHRRGLALPCMEGSSMGRHDHEWLHLKVWGSRPEPLTWTGPACSRVVIRAGQGCAGPWQQKQAGACVPCRDVPPLLQCPAEVWHAGWWGGGVIGWSLYVLGRAVLGLLRVLDGIIGITSLLPSGLHERDPDGTVRVVYLFTVQKDFEPRATATQLHRATCQVLLCNLGSLAAHLRTGLRVEPAAVPSFLRALLPARPLAARSCVGATGVKRRS